MYHHNVVFGDTLLKTNFVDNMSKSWVQIKIGNKVLAPIMIYDGTVACHINTMPTLSCTLNISQCILDIPIEFTYLKGDGISGKEYFRESIKMSPERGLVNTLSRIFGSRRTNIVNIDIFFNKNEEGLCIGFLCPRYIPTKYIVKGEHWNNEDRKKEVDSNALCGKPAKEIFVNNYQEFKDLLSLTAAHADSNILDKWEKAIKSIENSDLLYMEFKKYTDNLDTWLKLLCSWGLKQDGCKQYPGILINTDNYATDDNIAIDEERNYKVIVPCWTIWIEENGKRIEKLVSKGFVKSI